MFGTVGRARISEENRERLLEVFRRQSSATVPGMVGARLMFSEKPPGDVLIVAWFEDRDAYYRNAEDPAQHERYLEYRALLDDDPEWTDGEWHDFTPGAPLAPD